MTDINFAPTTTDQTNELDSWLNTEASHPHNEFTTPPDDTNDGDTNDAPPDESVQKGGRSKQARRKTQGADRGVIRRVAQKTVELSDADPDLRELLSQVLGCRDDVVTLAVEVMTAPKNAASVVSDIWDVTDADPMEAGILVSSWNRSRTNAMWGLLHSIGAVGKTKPPNDTKASLAIAKAVVGLDESSREKLERVVEMARKS